MNEAKGGLMLEVVVVSLEVVLVVDDDRASVEMSIPNVVVDSCDALASCC
jgi:hypothetical protein